MKCKQDERKMFLSLTPRHLVSYFVIEAKRNKTSLSFSSNTTIMSTIDSSLPPDLWKFILIQYLDGKNLAVFWNAVCCYNQEWRRITLESVLGRWHRLQLTLRLRDNKQNEIKICINKCIEILNFHVTNEYKSNNKNKNQIKRKHVQQTIETLCHVVDYWEASKTTKVKPPTTTYNIVSPILFVNDLTITSFPNSSPFSQQQRQKTIRVKLSSPFWTQHAMISWQQYFNNTSSLFTVRPELYNHVPIAPFGRITTTCSHDQNDLQILSNYLQQYNLVLIPHRLNNNTSNNNLIIRIMSWQQAIERRQQRPYLITKCKNNVEKSQWVMGGDDDDDDDDDDNKKCNNNNFNYRHSHQDNNTTPCLICSWEFNSTENEETKTTTTKYGGDYHFSISKNGIINYMKQIALS